VPARNPATAGSAFNISLALFTIVAYNNGATGLILLSQRHFFLWIERGWGFQGKKGKLIGQVNRIKKEIE